MRVAAHAFELPQAVVGRMLKGQRCEIEVSPVEGCVAAGFETFGVPVDGTVVLSVTLLSWVSVEDVSKENDGRITKRILVKGDGAWHKPRKRYCTSVDLEARRTRDDLEPLVRREGLELIVGAVRENGDVVDFGCSCDGADVAGALELVLQTMPKGEECEVRCTPESVGGTGLLMRIKMIGWTVIEPVPQTEHAVVRRILREAKTDSYERPPPLSCVEVRYVVRPRGSTEVIESCVDTPCTFVVSDGPGQGILPLVDMGVREMKAGEKSVLQSPTHWAYTSPEYLPPAATGIPAGAVEKTIDGVEVEVELVSITRGKDFFQLTGDEKVAEMAKYREAGNRLFKAGFLKRAIRRYDEAMRKEARENDFKDLAAEEKEGKLNEVQKQKLSTCLNLAAARIKLGEPKEALEQCSKAVDIDASSVKALYRRGQASLMLGDIEAARSDLMDAAKREPQNKDVRKELEKLKSQSTALKQQQKKLFGGMFSSS